MERHRYQGQHADASRHAACTAVAVASGAVVVGAFSTGELAAWDVDVGLAFASADGVAPSAGDDGENGSVLSLCVVASDDGKRVLVHGGTADASIVTWEVDVGGGRVTRIGVARVANSGTIFALHRLADGVLAAGTQSTELLLASSPTVDEDVARRTVGPAYLYALADAAAASDGVRRLFCALGNGSVVVLDADDTSRVLATWEAVHGSGVLALAVDEERHVVYTGGGDGMIKVWNYEADRCVRTLDTAQGSAPVLTLATVGNSHVQCK